MSNTDQWPGLPLQEWEATNATLHRWMQIVGKVRLAQSPWVNHSWHVPLYVTARGLSTSPMPHGDRMFEIRFDFIDHGLVIEASDGAQKRLPLRPQSVAAFYRELMEALATMGLGVTIHGRPNELEDARPFAEDKTHAAYDADAAQRFWRVLAQSDRVFTTFRAGFIGKCSLVHFFWGSFDLAVTRFSGRPAPQHPGGVPNLPDWVAREAYSHEVSSLGFWPGAVGGGPHPFPLFYSYAYPAPDGFDAAAVKPAGDGGAFFSAELREWVLPYETVRKADSPDEVLLAFARSTYDAAADLAKWDRAALEHDNERWPQIS